jgi:predicted metal-dependent peptidase
MAFDLNQEIIKLLQDEPFFAALSRRVDKKPGNIPTAGVRINPDTCAYEMIYNPEFFDGLPDEQRKGVLIHEFYHLVFDHVGGRRPDGVNHMAWNIATDLAINSLITEQGSRLDRLPEGCCVPGGKQFEEYPHSLSSEKYLEMLKNDPDKQGEGDGEGGEPQDGEEGEGQGQGEGGEQGDQQGSGSGNGNFDDHSGWEENSNSAATDIAKQKMKEAVRKAAEEAASGRGFGSAGGQAKKLILDSLKTKVDWKKVLRSFTIASVKADKRSTVKRINKRFPYIHSGKKVRRESKIAVCIDQSGSVDDAMLVKFYNELNKLCDLVEFDIIPFDMQVGEDHVYTWKKGQKRNWERVMWGGTCFDAPTKFVNESRGKYDGMIVLTDMMAPKPKRCRVKRLWMTTAEYAERPWFNPNPEKMVVVD